MKMLRLALCASTVAAAMGVLGCDVFLGGRPREDRVIVQQQPVYADPQPQYVIVQQAPPPMRIESRPPPPAAGYVWIEGSWNWDNQRYDWQPGRYERPPQPDVIWLAPRYESVGGQTRYTPGQWGRQDQGNDRGRGRGRN